MLNKIRIGLLSKFVLSISVIIILTALCLTWFFLNTQVVQIRTALEDKCTMLARNLADNSQPGVLTGNKDFLVEISRVVIKEQGVLYSVIYDPNGNVLSFTQNIRAKNIHKEVEPLLIHKMQTANKSKSNYQNPSFLNIIKLSFNSKSGEPIYDTTCPILIDRTPEASGELLVEPAQKTSRQRDLIGFARVGLSLANMLKQIERIKTGVAVLTLMVIGVGIILSVFLVKLIVKPLRQLSVGTRKIASGDLGYHVNVRSNDEIGDLANSFNQMAEDLRKYVRELNNEKQDLIAFKTALEQRTNELEETLIKMKNIQQELLRSEKFATIGRLASSIAHELRNPLASLKNISYYLIKLGTYKVDEKANQMLQLLSMDVLRANKIVTDLLDFSRIRKLNRTPVKIDEFVKAFLSSMDFGKDIKITSALENVEANIDPDRFTQVLVNIFSNSRDAMPEGGTINIGASKQDSHVVIRISDTGHGMDEETAARIFDPLFSTKNRGLGLSLAIVKEVVELHSGRIQVASKKGAGTTFEIHLPLN